MQPSPLIELSERRVMVTGVTGQIGYYVAEQLSRRGAKVYGLTRQTTMNRAASSRLPYIPISGDLLDEYSLLSTLEQIRPTHVLNFGAQSFIPASWSQPILTAQYTGLGVVRLLEGLRRAAPSCRFLQAGSSELFANSGVSPQNERTPICPANPYGIAKALAYQTVLAYRRQYDLFASNAVFFTNESPRRSPEFLFRKVTRSVAEIVAGQRDVLVLGNLDTVRDWGFAPEFAALAIALLEQPEPGDFVIATGDGHKISELVEIVFSLVGLDFRRYVRLDSTFQRPSEPAPLVGDIGKLRAETGLDVEVKFDALVRIMLAHDLGLHQLDVPFEVPAIAAKFAPA